MGKHIFRVYIKHYWHFEGVYPKQFYTLFKRSSNTDIFRELLANNTTHFSRAYIKQHWQFQRVTGKQYYTFPQSLYQAILTFLEGSFQIKLLQKVFSEFVSHNNDNLELISNRIHTFIGLLQNSSKYSFESFNRNLNRQKILKEKIPK